MRGDTSAASAGDVEDVIGDLRTRLEWALHAVCRSQIADPVMTGKPTDSFWRFEISSSRMLKDLKSPLLLRSSNQKRKLGKRSQKCNKRSNLSKARWTREQDLTQIGAMSYL